MPTHIVIPPAEASDGDRPARRAGRRRIAIRQRPGVRYERWIDPHRLPLEAGGAARAQIAATASAWLRHGIGAWWTGIGIFQRPAGRGLQSATGGAMTPV